MPGRSGSLIQGEWTEGGNAVLAHLTVDDRSGNKPMEYVATESIEFLPGFESGAEDAFVAYIDPEAVGGNGAEGNGLHRYGFNGKENDNEVKGAGNQQDYGMRIYDGRLGRFLSVDPLTRSYPMLTPYQFASNRPIDGIDRDGLEFEPYWSTTVPQKIREYETNLRKKDPANADRIIRQHNIRAFLFVATPLTVGWGASAIAVGSITRITVSTASWIANPSNQLLLSSSVGFVANVLNPDPNGMPVDLPGYGDELGRSIRGLFKSPVNVSGLLKSAGATSVNHIKGATSSKTAVIGQGMDKVKMVASGLKRPEVFNPTEEAVIAWDALLADYNGTLIPDNVVKGTQIYKENVKWINDVKKAGYDIIDTGGGSNSTFYNMEKEVVYGKNE